MASENIIDVVDFSNDEERADTGSEQLPELINPSGPPLSEHRLAATRNDENFDERSFTSPAVLEGNFFNMYCYVTRSHRLLYTNPLVIKNRWRGYAFKPDPFCSSQ